MLRVAAAQFSTGTDLEENLGTTLRMLGEACADGARLVVLPEFCNHLSIYEDAAHAWEVALDADGPWIAAVARRAGELGAWLQFNVTLRRRPATAASPRPVITNSNIVVRADGTIATISDKTVLMGAEGEHLTAATGAPVLTESPHGLLGSYACMDGIVPEVPRVVAAGGARILMNSLNSFALDEAALHVPVRAAENRAWVVACCKVGPLLPPHKLAAFSEMMGVPVEALEGAGESQVVAPDGTVVARGPRKGEAVVAADIDLDLCGMPRPDRTDPWAQRRPALYAPLARPTPPAHEHPRSDSLAVSALAPAAESATADEVARAVADGARLVVLPEMATDSAGLAAIVAELAGTDAVVVASVRDTDPAGHGGLVGVVLGAEGEIARQLPLHRSERHGPEAPVAEALVPVDLPWGRLAVVVGDDLVHPEVCRLAALDGVDVIAMPLNPLEEWETALGVIERAAENRVCVVAAARRGSAGECTVADLPPDFTLWAPSRERAFDGTINSPDVTRSPGRADAVVHPARSVHRQISKGTDLVDGRPWPICGALTV
jgi:predicted amidohydrolase